MLSAEFAASLVLVPQAPSKKSALTARKRHIILRKSSASFPGHTGIILSYRSNADKRIFVCEMLQIFTSYGSFV